jgi:hypothetical protein
LQAAEDRKDGADYHFSFERFCKILTVKFEAQVQASIASVSKSISA